jgi:amino acid permease
MSVLLHGIIAGNNLKDIIGKSFGIEMPDYSYYIIEISFFIIVIIIVLNNIKHLKKFSMFIMVMRFIIIF